MSALVPVPDRVPPLVARLGSDSDGERLACLHQLDRVLGKAGLTWTELARRLNADAAPACCASRKAPPVTDGDMLAWLYHGADASRLSARETEFLDNLWSCPGFWADEMRGTLRSAKQRKWLRDIYARVAREARYE